MENGSSIGSEPQAGSQAGYQAAEIPTTQTEKEADWPDLPSDHPLSSLLSKLDEIISEADYDEIYGIHLQTARLFVQKLILQKFLRGNANNQEKAQAQLLATLKWRKSFQPLRAKDEVFERARFEGLGYLTMVEEVPTTWNVYGKVRDAAATFGDLDGFMRWRVGMMELSLQRLCLENSRIPIPDYGAGPDPYQCLQVHDYLSVSFLRQDPHTKAAARRAIEVFQSYYPETLSRKLFVNVPVVMGWMFAAMKLVLSRETVKKFTVVAYGKDLAAELGGSVPKEYGGGGEELGVSGVQLNFKD